MGTMIQASDATLADFEGHEGCNEVLNATRPDVIVDIHRAYLATGADCVTTNTFGTNLANLGEYGITERIGELAEAGARLARQATDEFTAADGRLRWVIGSIGPGTKLPTLGHITFRELRDSYYENAAGLLRGGADALIIETCPDLLQAKAAIIGARRAVAALAPNALVIASLTIETTGTMLLGTEIGAALTALEPLGIDMIGLNCATGPGEMSEHLRYLAANSPIPICCQPNAGLPELTSDGAYYPLSPAELADAHDRFTSEFGLTLVGGCCGTTPEHIAALVDRLATPERRPLPRPLAPRSPRSEPGRRVPLQPRAVPAGHRVPRDRRADQRQRLQGVPRGDDRRPTTRTACRSPSPRPATAPTCSTSASTTSAGTASPTCARSPGGSAPPRRCRWCSTRPSPR